MNSKRSTSPPSVSKFILSASQPYVHPHASRKGSTNILPEPWSDSVRRLGYRGSREVWRSKRWLLHQRPVRYHHVRRDLPNHIQERPQLASYVQDRVRVPRIRLTTFPQVTSSASAKTSPSFSAATKSTSRSEKSSPRPSPFTARRTFSTTTFRPSPTTTSKSPSSGWHENSSAILSSNSSPRPPLHLLKSRLTRHSSTSTTRR